VISNSCEIFNSNDFSICEKCKSGYLRVMDSKTCVDKCPPTYTLHRDEKECHLDVKIEAKVKRIKAASYSFTVITNVLSIF